MNQSKREALRIIRSYISNCPNVYVSFEKMSYYKWALNEALKTVKHCDDSPLEILERLLERYDDFADRDNPKSYIFSVAAHAVDDLIDTLITQ